METNIDIFCLESQNQEIKLVWPLMRQYVLSEAELNSGYTIQQSQVVLD